MSRSYLFWPKSWWHPGVLLQRTPRVIVRCGAPLEANAHLSHLSTVMCFHLLALKGRTLPSVTMLQIHHPLAL